MKKILYASQDNHYLYESVDEPARFHQVEVEETITLNSSQLCGGYGDILEILVKSGQGKIVCPATEG